MPQNCHKDAIDRKTGFIERMFDRFFLAVNKDLKGFFIVILVITNLLIFWKYTESLETRLAENQAYSDEMIRQVRRSIMPEIERKMDNKVEEIGKKTDSINKGLEKTQKLINKAIEIIK